MNEMKPVPDDAAGASPMMAQYLEIKAAHRGYLLFYRMGDFYELFFEDAAIAAEALDIALTKRGKHLGADIPMCGVPVHSAEQYLEKLIRKGFRVAVCEQIEDPEAARRRGSRAVVARQVVRIVTPGTLTEDALLEPRAANLLAALGRAEGGLALAAADISTGDFAVGPVTPGELAAELARFAPRELLVPDGLLDDEVLAPLLKELGGALTPLPAAKFDSASGERALKGLFGVAALDAFGAFTRADLSAAGALVGYLELTQKGRIPSLMRPVRRPASGHMSIDAATRRNLELTETLSGKRKGSLLATIDRTVTAGGARELQARLAAPLTTPAAICERLDAVACLLAERETRQKLREELRRAPDIARALARLSVGRGGPRDLANLRDGLHGARAVRTCFAVLDGPMKPALGELSRARDDLDEGLRATLSFVARLDDLLVAEPPVSAGSGGFIAGGVHAPLDEARSLRDESRRVVASLEARYRGETGIASLKIRHNAVLGYFVEVTPVNADRLAASPAAGAFRHRQTIGSAVRYTTDELATLAARIAEAGERALALEMEIFESLAAEAVRCGEPIGHVARALARIDVAASLAALAEEHSLVRPVVDDSLVFHVTRGRHLVVEAALSGAHAGPFVPNDCDLSPGGPGRIWLVTGPNMAGKSTFLRQNALIAVLAQMGGFVPAESAHIGVVDRLFSRVGAADDLARGRSTFMVEMVETAAILHQAGERALVILDEIGRGTATFDGLAIAWAAIEHLHHVTKARTLFATHYHELTALAGRLSGLACVAMRVREWKDTIVFLHEVAPGAADRSYGIHVAKLAGLPPAVVARAEEVLRALEEGREGHKPLARIDDLPLFAAAPAPRESPRGNPALAALAAADPDALTPKEALELLYRLKKLGDEG